VTQPVAQRRRDLVRSEIAKLGIELFIEHGFDAVTVDEISAAAEISQRTFFRYFVSKDEIALDLARRLDDRLIDALEARPLDEGPITALREAFRITSRIEPATRARTLRLATVLGSVPQLRARAQGERLHGDDGLVNRITEVFGKRGRDRSLRVALTAMVAVAGVEFERWAAGGGKGDPSVQIVEALRILEGGLASLDHR
jgi:AcrR family transcriptional regulator